MINSQILEALNSVVYGHLEAKKVLITLVKRSFIRYEQRFRRLVDRENLIEPLKVLLIGDSGTGKTYLVDCLAEICNFPLVKVDATRLGPIGGSGMTSKDLEKLICKKADEYVKEYSDYYSIEGAIDRTVVFIDEVDKLANAFESSGNWNKHVQSNFLTLLDNKDQYSGVSFILSGAFSELQTKQISKNIGFVSTLSVDEKQEIYDDAIIAHGLIPELVGRINYIVNLDKFTEEDLTNILMEILLPKKYLDMAAFGVFDVFNIDYKQIVDKALKSGQGVRVMKRELNKIFLEEEFNAEPRLLEVW